MARTDIHRPSVIVPTDYQFVAIGNMKIESLGDCYEMTYQRKVLREHMERTGGRFSMHEHGGNCHVCGAHCCWTIVFYHQKTNTYIRTGSDCADKLDMAYDQGDLDRFKKSVATAEKNRAGKAKAKLMLEKAGLGAAWDIHLKHEEMVAARVAFNREWTAKRQAEFEKTGDWEEITSSQLWYRLPECPPEPIKDSYTLNDMVSKAIAWGDPWTEKQENFARILIDRIQRQPEIEAARAAEAAAAEPVPVTDKRIVIEGEVVSTKVVDGGFGTVIKCQIKTAAGWRCWGTRPLPDLKRGDKVRFIARLKPSDDDPKFGFFSRPTKAEVL